jgi:hypothetical protein
MGRATGTHHPREAQPAIADPIIREKAKEKISKVVRRRYLVTTDIKIKSLIKYFAVPNGEDMSGWCTTLRPIG